MTIRTTPGLHVVPDKHELLGWDELHCWAMFNHPYWRKIVQRTSWADMSELDKLRLLAGAMLTLNVELEERTFEAARRSPDRVYMGSATKPDET